MPGKPGALAGHARISPCADAGVESRTLRRTTAVHQWTASQAGFKLACPEACAVWVRGGVGRSSAL